MVYRRTMTLTYYWENKVSLVKNIVKQQVSIFNFAHKNKIIGPENVYFTLAEGINHLAPNIVLWMGPFAYFLGPTLNYFIINYISYMAYLIIINSFIFSSIYLWASN